MYVMGTKPTVIVLCAIEFSNSGQQVLKLYSFNYQILSYSFPKQCFLAELLWRDSRPNTAGQYLVDFFPVFDVTV